MRSKPLGLEYYSPLIRRRVLDNAQFDTMDRLARMECNQTYNQTEALEMGRVFQRESAEAARANRDLLERSLQQQQQFGGEFIAGLTEITRSLDALETSLGARLDELNDTAAAAVSVLRNIEDMLFHIATGKDYNATLRRRAAEAEEARRQQIIIADYNDALGILKDAGEEANASKRRLQLEQAELCLRKAMSVHALEAQAAMTLGTLLIARDENLDEGKKCYERSLELFTRWSPQWVYVSGLLANVESRGGSHKYASERMEQIIGYRTSLARFSDEVCAINRDDDWDARVKRLSALLAQIHALGGTAPERLASIAAELDRGMKITVLTTLEKAETQLLNMFKEAQPDPEVFYHAARFAADCGMHSEAALHLKTRSALCGQDLLARRAFLLQVQATPEFAS